MTAMKTSIRTTRWVCGGSVAAPEALTHVGTVLPLRYADWGEDLPGVDGPVWCCPACVYPHHWHAGVGVRSTGRDRLLRQHGADQMVRGLLSVQSAQLQVIYRAPDHGRSDRNGGQQQAQYREPEHRLNPVSGPPQRVAVQTWPSGAPRPATSRRAGPGAARSQSPPAERSGRRGETVRDRLSSACRPPATPAQGHAGPLTGTLVRFERGPRSQYTTLAGTALAMTAGSRLAGEQDPHRGRRTALVCP